MTWYEKEEAHTWLRSRRMLTLALLLAAALVGDPTLAKDKTAGTDADRQDASQRVIRLGMSADFSASARALSIELYRGAMAYLLPLNNAGGVAGRRVVIKAYDDRYEPDLAIRNTQKLMGEDDVFALFSYVGTPTMVLVRVLRCRGEKLEHGPAADKRECRDGAVDISVAQVADESSAGRIGADTDNGIGVHALHDRHLTIVALIERRAAPIGRFAGDLQTVVIQCIAQAAPACPAIGVGLIEDRNARSMDRDEMIDQSLHLLGV